MSAGNVEEHGERGRAWLMLAAGTLAAATEAWMVCTRLRPSPKESWAGAILWSVSSIAACVAGGVVTAWGAGRIAGALLHARRTDGSLIRKAAVGWAFLPCILLMTLQRWWLVYPVAALAAAAATFRLRPLFRAPTVDARSKAAEGGSMPSLDGLPPMGAPPLRWFAVALCAQACAVLAVSGRLALASAALAACLAMLIAWGTAWNGHGVRWWAGRPRAGQLYVTAALLTLLLTPWVAGGRGLGLASVRARTAAGPSASGKTEPGHTGADYVGIILWPPPVKKVDIVPPRPNSPEFGRGIGPQPLVIPFDGPYWYFKAPYQEPGPKAHVTFGKPTLAKVRSADWMPLRMEAHQNLGLPIDLDCCREIDVTVTNADLGVGAIVMSVVLTDSSAPLGRGSLGRGSLGRSLILGAEPVISSEGMPAPAGREPVTETLKFAVPRAATITRFDTIDVVIQPTVERARSGSKVEVDSFKLIPK